MTKHEADVLIIGAGPSGALAAAHLLRRGLKVLILEKETFPRFSIGESLLPQSMGLLEDAGLLRPVVEAGFQFKNGATFNFRGEKTAFDFREKTSEGWGTIYQVERALFDTVLANAVAKQGAEVRFRNEILEVTPGETRTQVKVRGEDGEIYEASGRFLLDASGFGRVLPRMLKLERPSDFPVRQAIYGHIHDHIGRESGFDRNKILISSHPDHPEVWYWLIPFSSGHTSVGVVGEKAFFAKYGTDLPQTLRALHDEEPSLRALLKDAVWDVMPARAITGYATNVSALHGPGFALLGNAGEFLDPVFSSGVTIAFKSASLAAPLVARQLAGETVDWEREYATPLKAGVAVFRGFVESWYRGAFLKVIFHPRQDPQVRKMICAVMAGYAWDQSNPYVAEPRRLRTLETLCAE